MKRHLQCLRTPAPLWWGVMKERQQWTQRQNLCLEVHSIREQKLLTVLTLHLNIIWRDTGRQLPADETALHWSYALRCWGGWVCYFSTLSPSRLSTSTRLEGKVVRGEELNEAPRTPSSQQSLVEKIREGPVFQAWFTSHGMLDKSLHLWAPVNES